MSNTDSTTIYKALFAAQQEIGVISKDLTNPFHKSKYADINALIEQIMPILQKHGLLLLQPTGEGKVVTQIWHAESGGLVESSLDLPNETNPQKMGSAITYHRRHTLQSLLALRAKDDDGNKASLQEKQINQVWDNATKTGLQTDEDKLRGAKNLNELKTIWTAIKPKTLELTALKDELKNKLV